MIQNGVKDLGLLPFESPNPWEISNCFLSKEFTEAYDASIRLEEHLKGSKYDYWLAEFVKEPEPKPRKNSTAKG